MKKKKVVSHTQQRRIFLKEILTEKGLLSNFPHIKLFFFLIEKKGIKILLLSLITENSLICKKLINSQKINGKVLSF